MACMMAGKLTLVETLCYCRSIESSRQPKAIELSSVVDGNINELGNSWVQR